MKTEDIGILIKDQFGLTDWNPHAPEYDTIEPDEVSALITPLPMENYNAITYDCFEKALGTMSDVRRLLASGSTLKAFGWAEGTMFQGVEKSHVVNLFLSKDGIYLIDRETKQMWKASKNDKIFWVVM